MSTTFFDDEEFRDVPEEVSGKDAIQILQEQQAGPVAPRRAPVTSPQKQNAASEEEQVAYEYEGLYPTQDEDDEEDYSAVLSDARLRLEQGRLYEMIMNHDLFDGTDADENAVRFVQRQIRKFAKEQMEIMLGMRKETAKIERLEIDFPFNAVEVEVLKMVADKASGGRSANSDRYVPEVTRTTEEVPVIGSKRQGLNSIVSKKSAPIKPKAQIAAPQAKSALRKSPEKPVARKVATNTPEQIVVDGEVVTREQIDAQFEPEYKPLEKPLHEMTSDQLLKRNQETSQRRHKTVKNSSAMPMLTYEQEEMMHLQRMTDSASKTNAVSLIMNAINSKK